MCEVDGMAPSVVLAVLLLAASPVLLAACARTVVPEPLPGHPGNVFLAGEDVSVPVPDGAVEWRATDIDGDAAASGRIEKGSDRALLGALGR